MRAPEFWREWTFFWQNMGMRAEIFFVKNRGEKKGHPFDFFGLYCSVVLTEVTFFLTKYGHDSRGFFMKIWKKNDIRTLCFWGNGRFFYKIGQDSSEFFWRKEVFLTKYGHESSYFFVKNRRKNKASWFFWSIIYRSFDRIDVSWPKRAWQHGVFHKKSEKNDMRIVFLRERAFYWQNIGMSPACFLENRRFLIKYRHGSIDLFVKNWKKGYAIDFFGP